MSKKLILLSIVLLTSLSATLLNKMPVESKKEDAISTHFENLFEQETETTKKLKQFNAKDYLEDYERQKKARRMMVESLK